MSKGQRRWSAREDAILRGEVELQLASRNGKAHDWNRISDKIPGRSNKDCRKRFYNGVTEGLKKGPWTEEEDHRLEDMVRQHGQAWVVVASQMKTRTADQCAKRWAHSLDPALDRSPWTEYETTLLIRAVQSHGTAWKDIQQLHFPKRAANNVKNQHTLIRRKMTAMPTDLAPCCVCTMNGLEGGKRAARSPGSFQEHSPPNSLDTSVSSSSTDIRGGTSSTVFDAGGDPTSRLSPICGPDESCLTPTLLSEAPRQSSRFSRTHSSFSTLPDGLVAINPLLDSLESLEHGISISSLASSSSQDPGNKVKSKTSEPSNNPASHVSPTVGSNEVCFDPSLLLEQLQQPLRPSAIELPFDMSLDESMTVDSTPASLENMAIKDSILGPFSLEHTDDMNLAFVPEAAFPSATDGHAFSDLDFSIGDGPDQAAKALKATITLDDAEPSIVSSIMNILIHSKAKVRFEMQDPQG